MFETFPDMEVLKMANSRVSLLRHSLNSFFPPSATSTFSLSILPTRRFIVSASISSKEAFVDSLSSQQAATPFADSENPKLSNRWKPMCLYYTQDKCTMVSFSIRVFHPYDLYICSDFHIVCLRHYKIDVESDKNTFWFLFNFFPCATDARFESLTEIQS